MSTRVTWQPSSDAAIFSYVLDESADAVTWSNLDTIIDAPRDGTNVHYDVTNAVFFYTHAAGTASTWYRLAAVDTLAQQSAWSPAFQAGGSPVPPWETVQQIVETTAMDVGLGDAGNDVMASTDANIMQLCSLLKNMGRNLVHFRNWQHLRKEYTFTTVAGQSIYPMPADFMNMIDQTWWNRTNRLPVGGPITGQEWQFLRARLVGVVFNVLFRVQQRQIYVYPVTSTPGGYEIAFEYNSAYWISTTGTPDTATANAPTLSTDYVWYDPFLMVRGLKLAFLKAKGFDTTAAQQDYNEALSLVQAHDSPMAKLSLTSRNIVGIEPLIGQQSVPITGFGSP